MSAQTTAEDFSILKNAIDSQLEIIQHNETGFYNITKTAKMVAVILKSNELVATNEPEKRINLNDASQTTEVALYGATSSKVEKRTNLDDSTQTTEVAGYPATSSKPEKRTNDWFRNASTIEIIDQIKMEYSLDVVHYELKKGTPTQFAGTYVHKYLYQHFLAWLDPRYAVKILKIVDDLQEAANRKLLEAKDIELSALSKKMKRRTKTLKQMITNQTETLAAQTETLTAQTAKIDQLLSFGNKLVGQNDKLQLTVDMTREELGQSLDYLVDKSFHSTIDPEDPGKITHFAILAPDNDSREGRTMLIRGQVKYIKNVINKYSETHIPVVDCTYNANAINLIVNARAKYDKMVRKYINTYNIPIREYNERLKQDIKKHNSLIIQMRRKKQPTTLIKRFYAEERKCLLTLSDIPIIFKSTYIWYISNTHFSYQDVIQTITETNELTQKCPIDPEVNLATDDSSSSDEE